ncbi:hypothetical protein pneo_cds_719 [Pandoravirus neocaledonia]|uniref:F-box incomplete domain containing protein n=1 Tax=Pandoravirus neocaledonia TaxID=2107708 RepID=A0A2U7UD17_9VIRU|nr:hypothetical protein pneo_cds_719 [Pandoravirus neocaledonia]AVK76326.1 hypothetical protein pneo_cds_719 [Pandoravirus neocaledonia]
MFGVQGLGGEDGAKLAESIRHIVTDMLNTRPKKRARTSAYGTPPYANETLPDCAIALLPAEVLEAILDWLAPRDLAAVAASGTPLCNAARAMLARRLTRALAVTGVDDVEDDPLGALVVLHNAISRDDSVTTKAVLLAGLARSIDEPLPPIKSMLEWDTPVVAAFYLDNDGTMERGDSKPWEKDNGHRYDIGFDVSTSTSSTLRSWRVLPHTPLVRAIQCGARKCVRVLLAAGARPHPSPEALLGCAVDRIFHTHVAIAESHCRNRDYWNWDKTWAPQPHRSTDRVGIVEDLVAAFARTPPPLPLLDDNPLSALRYGALVSCRRGHGTAATDLERVLGVLLDAGYSPDERMSQLPPFWGVLGTPEERTEKETESVWTRLSGPDSRPWMPRDAFARRREPDRETEREAAAVMCVRLIRESGGNAKSMIIPMSIISMYERLVPRSAALDDTEAPPSATPTACPASRDA